MSLREILKDIDYTLLSGSLDTEVNDITYDSRNCLENDMFVALKGYFVDGHDFLPEAILKKASVLVISKMVPISSDKTVIKVEDTRVFLAYASRNFFGNPASKLTMIGVTGTTGKTTTTHMIRDMLVSSNRKCGLIGSMGIIYEDKIVHTENTTPESYEVQKSLFEMVKHGVTHVAMETSSQAFKMHRLDGILFDIGVLTNITSDHIGLNEHATHEEYVACKRELFLHSKEVIINRDSLYLEEVLKDVKSPIYYYGIDQAADLNATNITLMNTKDLIGTKFETYGLVNEEFILSMPGKFNIYNSLCAILIGYILGLDSKNMKEALLKTSVRGRMETALVTPKFKVIIDYAHTEDAMKSLVETLKEYQPKRLVCVFGSGGNRDKTRRYNLGEIIGKISDLCIITMDNPRFESLREINEDIKVGLNKVNAKYIEIDDRKDAIFYACRHALEGDLIVLIGKGHEEYQEIKGIKYPFSELEILNEINT